MAKPLTRPETGRVLQTTPGLQSISARRATAGTSDAGHWPAQGRDRQVPGDAEIVDLFGRSDKPEPREEFPRACVQRRCHRFMRSRGLGGGWPAGRRVDTLVPTGVRASHRMLPIGTDAPLYHWPIATVVMIVANIAATLTAWNIDPETSESWMLAYGQGLHPSQWLTYNFLHADLFHLAGNLVFLWTFGLIVEGKVGPLAFSALFLGLGIVEGALVQTAMLGFEGTQSALGASGAICGLIGIGLVWAPRNEISVVLIYTFGFMPRIRQFDWPVVGFAALFLAWQIFTGFFSLLIMGAMGRYIIATEGLHLIGAILGFALGTVLVKSGWVDCEGWDLFARGISGRRRTSPGPPSAQRRTRTPVDVEARSAEALGNLRAALDEGAALEALASHQYLARMASGWRPLESDLLRLIGMLQKAGHTPESLPVMKEYVSRFPGKGARVRLKLAQILLRDQHRPAAALRVLADIQEPDLPDDLRALRQRMEQEAHRLIDAGDLELEGEAW